VGGMFRYAGNKAADFLAMYTMPGLTEINDEREKLASFNLKQNYPNPFNPVTVIRYDIPNNSLVEVSVFDILGRQITTLVNNEAKNPGTYEVRFDGSGLASGIYFYQLRAGAYVQTRKMNLMR
jgi:hypothetical protein